MRDGHNIEVRPSQVFEDSVVVETGDNQVTVTEDQWPEVRERIDTIFAGGGDGD